MLDFLQASCHVLSVDGCESIIPIQFVCNSRIHWETSHWTYTKWDHVQCNLHQVAKLASGSQNQRSPNFSDPIFFFYKTSLQNCPKTVKWLGWPTNSGHFVQAVSWLDYSWDLRRTKTCIATPYGEQCASSSESQPSGLQLTSMWAKENENEKKKKTGSGRLCSYTSKIF